MNNNNKNRLNKNNQQSIKSIQILISHCKNIIKNMIFKELMAILKITDIKTIIIIIEEPIVGADMFRSVDHIIIIIEQKII